MKDNAAPIWLTLDSDNGLKTLKQHAFRPKVCRRKFTREEHDGNISLCNRAQAVNEGEDAIDYWLLRSQGSEERVDNACKICTRVIKKIRTESE